MLKRRFFLLAMVLSWMTGRVESAQLTVGPYLQKIAPDAVTVTWRTDEETIGAVQYGENSLDRFVTEDAPTRLHRVRITGLQSDTLYAYRCRWEDVVSETSTFKTIPPLGADNLTVAVVGETRGDPEIARSIASQIGIMQPSVVWHTGGLLQSGKEEGLDDSFFSPFHAVLRSIPFTAVLSGLPDSLLANFDREDRSYWKQDYASVRLIVLDESLTGDRSDEQDEWLEQTLRTTPQKWLVVLLRHPLFSAHPVREVNHRRWKWQPLFQEYQVDLVLSGGDAAYARSYPIGAVAGYPQYGVLHVTTGGGGAELEPTAPEYFIARRASKYNFLMLEFGDDRIIGRAYDEKGAAIDSFIRDKKAGVSPDEFVSFEMMRLQRALNDWADKSFYNWDSAELHASAEIPAGFHIPIRGTIRWNGGDGWTLSSRRDQEVVLQPGQPLKISFTAAYTAPERIYPLPVLHFDFRYDDYRADFHDPIRGFRNHEFDISPLQVLKKIGVFQTPRTARSIVKSGSSSLSWNKAAYLDEFYVNETGAAPKQDARIGILHDDENLYLNAKMLQHPDFIENASIYSDNDDPDVLINEHLQLLFSAGDDRFSFVVSSNGAWIDSKNGDFKWDSGWNVETWLHLNAWETEITIPLQAIGGAVAERHFNVLRYDALSGETSSIRPSFSRNPDQEYHMPVMTLAP